MQKSPQVVKHVVKGEKWACSTLKTGKNKPVTLIAKTRDFVRICEEIKEKSGILRLPIFGASIHNRFLTKAKAEVVETYSKAPKCLCLQEIFKHERNMNMEKYIIENGIKYELHGDIYYPMLKLYEQTDYQIGKYGCLHLDYIKQYRKVRYNTLLIEARLNTYLHEIDVQAYSMLDNIIANLAKERDIDEKLKAHDMLKWIAEMNNIKASAEKIVLMEVIYQ